MGMKVWIKALLILAIIIAAINVSAYAATGTWLNRFAIQSMSMEPNMQAGDIILVQSSQRTGIITYEEGEMLNHTSFNDYGDVIIYRPNGFSSATPIIHRAMHLVEKGEEMLGGKPAPHAGYITKGDRVSEDMARKWIEYAPKYIHTSRDICDYCTIFNQKRETRFS